MSPILALDQLLQQRLLDVGLGFVEGREAARRDLGDPHQRPAERDLDRLGHAAYRQRKTAFASAGSEIGGDSRAQTRGRTVLTRATSRCPRILFPRRSWHAPLAHPPGWRRELLRIALFGNVVLILVGVVDALDLLIGDGGPVGHIVGADFGIGHVAIFGCARNGPCGPSHKRLERHLTAARWVAAIWRPPSHSPRRATPSNRRKAPLRNLRGMTKPVSAACISWCGPCRAA